MHAARLLRGEVTGLGNRGGALENFVARGQQGVRWHRSGEEGGFCVSPQKSSLSSFSLALLLAEEGESRPPIVVFALSRSQTALLTHAKTTALVKAGRKMRSLTLHVRMQRLLLSVSGRRKGGNRD